MKKYRIVYSKKHEAYLIQRKYSFFWRTMKSAYFPVSSRNTTFSISTGVFVKFDTVEKADEFIDEYEKYIRSPKKELAKTVNVMK